MQSADGVLHTRELFPSLLAAMLLALALGLAASPAVAGPPDEQAHVAIPPGREQAARELLAPLLEQRPDDLSLRGPSIERERIEWWLMRGEQARARLLLLPRSHGELDDPRSKSFAMQIAWEPEVEPEPAERALLAEAIAAVQERDQGGFYVLLPDTMLAREEPTPTSGPASRPISTDPDHTRRLWARKLAGVIVLLGFAVAVTLRPNPNRASPRR